jgi:nitrous oxidase accessory protein
MKRIFHIFFILPISISLLVLKLSAKEISVSPDGIIISIKQAISYASDGDTIIVYQGNYDESDLQIDKELTLLGINYPIIDGNKKSAIINIISDNVTIKGFIIQNAGVSFISDNAGIKLNGVKNCVIENNRLLDNFFAIYLAQSENCRISNNQIISNALRESSSGNGIHLWYCKDMLIENNMIAGHRDGIYFEFVEKGLVRNNLSERNLRYGLHFMFSNNCRYVQNNFRQNGAGVAVMYTKKVIMDGNRFENNQGPASYGILLKDISDSEIINNQFIKNSIGLYTEASNRLQIEKNVFINNGWAVKVMANSMDNVFKGNDFLNNSFDVATNSRQNFNKFTGNYWNKYKGYDLNRDGVGDVPYRPVRLFSLIVERQHPALILLKSFFIEILEVAESIFPVLTPETLIDNKPRMRRIS